MSTPDEDDKWLEGIESVEYDIERDATPEEVAEFGRQLLDDRREGRMPPERN
jgi:hypothetical protein